MTSPQTGITRVVRDPHVQGGEPVVKGTRVTVASVMRRSGMYQPFCACR